MKPAVLALAALSLAGGAPAADSSRPTVAFTGPDGIVLLRGAKTRLLLRGAAEPSWSPDGLRLAYVAAGAGGASDLFVIDADGQNRGRITWSAGVDETSPSWSPDGKRIVVERSGEVVTVRADGRGERRLAGGWEPAWSPVGERIAYSDGNDLYVVSARERRRRRLTATPAPEGAPAWAPDGKRVAFISEQTGAADVHVLDLRSGRITRLTADAAIESSPAFAGEGRSVVFVSDRAGVDRLWRVPARGGQAVPLVVPPLSADPASRPLPGVLELLPDLDQQPPSDLDVRPARRGFRLWFTSAADNVGAGPLIVNGRRSGNGTTMRANQRVRRTDGSLRTNPAIGMWRYNPSPDHSHWHLLHYQRYELRSLDRSVVVRDRKSGFCIGDRYGVAPGKIKGRIRSPVFKGFCNLYDPASLSVDGGTSVGYSDRYHSRLDGQNLDISRVPAGEYLLVNRVNTQLLIRELRYENNAASRRIRIAWPNGRRQPPSVRVLRTCPDSDRC